MKFKLLITFVILLSFSGFSQRGVAPLGKGGKQLNFGIGFSNHGLPVYFAFDFAVHKDVTLTPVVSAYLGDNFGIGAGLKCDYHWNYLMGIPSNWDFYTGGRVGFDFEDDFNADFRLQIGGRWYWSPKWGLNLELGGGNGFGTTLGVSMKL
jgi:hypothetical protein